MGSHRRRHDADDDTVRLADPQPAGQPPAEDGLAPAEQAVLDLGGSAGNQAVAGLLGAGPQRLPILDDLWALLEGSDSDDDVATAPDPDSLAPETPAPTTPEHPAPERPQMDLAGGQQILTRAYGGLHEVVPGNVRLLGQAEFQAAYDAIYGETQYSWDRYVVPRFGGLNGFADTEHGISYINTASAGLHTVVHEMLHQNACGDWDAVVRLPCHELDEGSTEVLTQEACALFDEPSPTCYPGQTPVVREMMHTGLSLDELSRAYLNGSTQTLIADWVDSNCLDSWEDLKRHMEAQDWAAAQAGVGPMVGDFPDRGFGEQDVAFA